MKVTIELERANNSSRQDISKIIEEAEKLSQLAIDDDYDVKITIVSA